MSLLFIYYLFIYLFIMPINDTTPELLREITSLCFEISNNFKLLGLDINNKLDNVMEIYQSIKEKNW